MEAATGAMRAIMDRLSQDKCEKLASITEQDLQVCDPCGDSASSEIDIYSYMLHGHNPLHEQSGGTFTETSNI